MNRRFFVQAGATSLLMTRATISASAGSQRGVSSDCVFFDERFAAARRLTVELPGRRTVPVQSDVTAFWTAGLGRVSLSAPLILRGVTTESFYFCLKVLLADQVRVDAQVTRLDRDLHLWTIRTDNQLTNGTTS